jgi:hypothetical protein
MANKKEIAKYMVDELQKDGILHQDFIVYEIIEKFGEDYTYLNPNGNYAIDKGVLQEFRKMTEDSVVWVRGERYWRKREEDDEVGKRQVDY